MGYVVRMPKMGLEMEEGEVVEWNFDEGEAVEEGDAIAVAESEKVSNDIEAREDGALRRIVAREGEVVEPGDPIAIVADGDEDISEYDAELSDSVEREAEGEKATPRSPADATEGESTPSAGSDDSASDIRATPGARRLAEKHDIDLAEVDGTGPQGTITEDDVEEHPRGRGESETDATETTVRATPGAKQLAAEHDVDLAEVDGTGPQGTITEDDVEEAVDASSGPSSSTEATRTVREIRAQSGIQQTVADRMSESYRSAPHVTLNRSFDARRLQTVREVATAEGIDVSLTDLLLAVLSTHLDDNPEFNALYEDGEYKLIDEVNIGVAVDVEDGLLTPVIPDTATKSIEAISAVRTERTEDALSGDFSMDDLSGGTFTVSNLGMFGIDDFDPIINPPEIAILGVGQVREDGTMTLSLSFDHRVINGAEAARFLDSLVDRLTDVSVLVSEFDSDLLAE